jgi:heme oxygenase
VRNPVAQLLKQHTAQIHERVEAGLDLLGPDLTIGRLREVVARLAGFWQGTERSVEAWAENRPEAAAALQWPRRRRSAALRQDLLRLGLTGREITALPEAPPTFTGLDTGDVLGWLYVTEGSTLGGAVIDRTVRTLAATAELRLRTFTPYLEGPGPMWQSYLDWMLAWVGDDARRRDRVLSSAHSSFTALEAWLDPIRNEAAA